MASKTLYLHIGAHKTGTTYLQRALHLNRDWFARAGVDTLTDLAVWGQGHHNVAWSYMNWALPGEQLTPDQYRSRFVRRLRDSPLPSIFLSSEFFERFDDDAVELLCNDLAGYRIVLIYTVRNQPEYLQSLYREDVKHGAADPLGAWLTAQQLAGIGDFHRVIRRWTMRLAGPALRIVIYDNLRSQGQNPLVFMAREILSLSGSADLQLPQEKLINASIDTRLMGLMKEMNLRHSTPESHAAGMSQKYVRMRRRLERAYQGRTLAVGAQPATLLDQSTASAIELHYAASNARLQEEFGASICNPVPHHPLFRLWTAQALRESPDVGMFSTTELLDILFEVLQADVEPWELTDMDRRDG